MDTHFHIKNQLERLTNASNLYLVFQIEIQELSKSNLLICIGNQHLVLHFYYSMYRLFNLLAHKTEPKRNGVKSQAGSKTDRDPAH